MSIGLAKSSGLCGSIGIMQGRLSPPIEGRIQAFPKHQWEEEFFRARDLGLVTIEWIVEEPLEQNPFWTDEGLARIQNCINRTGILVEFICADIFMESPWVKRNASACERNRAILNHLIVQASKLRLRGIEIPCVDHSAINTREEEDDLLVALAPSLDCAAEKGIEIGLETSLPPQRFRDLLGRCGHPAIRANYDTGNSASLGFDPDEENGAYGGWINNIHIKDRKRFGGTVPFGAGDTPFGRVFKALYQGGYSGGFILQGARNGSEMETVARYARQLRAWLELASGEPGGT